MTRGRPITSGERALWRRATADIAPRSDAAASPPPPDRPEPPDTPARPAKPRVAADTAPPPKPGAPSPVGPPALDRRRATDLRRGKIRPEARIDLHGLTLARAHPRLTAFLQRAHDQGARVVLVITGKGRGGGGDDAPHGTERGILRRQVPQWLRQPPLAPIILEIAPAHPRHGGDGALYVWFRRPRNRGLQPPGARG